jgi:hypothetical protein
MGSRLPLFLVTLFISSILVAQRGPGGPSGHAYGRVLDADKKPVAFATVRVTLGDSLVGGALVAENGDFDLPKLPLRTMTLRIAALGYTPFEKSFTLTTDRPEMDLGNLTMVADAVVLNAAVITKERATQVLQVDRRVYNVDKDISVTGGNGTDVMKNIPGLSVDVDGNVEMRGKSPQILVDGRPTTMTLDQIPAADIERVEVITNPSVLFDASATGGIVNVIMKKSIRPGYSGQLQGGFGNNGRYNASGSLLMRQGRSAITLSYGLGHSATPGHSYNDRTDLADGAPVDFFRQDATSENARMRHNARAGWDYKLSNRNTLSLMQSVGTGYRNSTEDQAFVTSDAAHATTGTGTQYNISDYNYTNLTSRVGFKRTTTKPGKEWSTDLTYNFGDRTSPASTEQTDQGADGDLPPRHNLQTRDSQGKDQSWTWQADVVDPYADNRKFEWGFKSYYDISTSSMDVANSGDSLPVPMPDTVLSNAFDIRTLVNAAYANWST